MNVATYGRLNQVLTAMNSSVARLSVLLCAIGVSLGIEHGLAAPWSGYVRSDYFNEQVREIRFAEDCRAVVIAPSEHDFDSKKETLLIIFATPNGNTAEQTLGCQLAEGIDWHFDIQHVAAQSRAFRQLATERNVVLACVQAKNLSWPTWKRERPHGPRYIRQIVESLTDSLPSKNVSIVLAAHSGGGSFLFGYVDAGDEIPESIERIAFLDANYGYDNEQKHGDKIASWLRSNPDARFIVLAYDDRNIELEGKKVVGPTGGTYRATERMLEFLRATTTVDESQEGPFKKYTAIDDRLIAMVHPNPDNLILHTRLVGEMNGVMEVLTYATELYRRWGQPAAPRAYTDYIQSKPYASDAWRALAPALPPRRPNAPAGSVVTGDLMEADQSEWEENVVRQILCGNVPRFWREFKTVAVELPGQSGPPHEVELRVSPDYLMLGNDEDFVRVPLTPHLAQLVADVAGCVLPTRKMVDDIYHSSTVKLAPLPLSQEREAVATFLHHHNLIQNQLRNYPIGELVAGIKKDVVVTNRLGERPGRVAIYGWHKLDAHAIQPLTTVHVDSYVDYSHGIRLVDQWCTVDGRPVRIDDVLSDAALCRFLSDEGMLEFPRYSRREPSQTTEP